MKFIANELSYINLVLIQPGDEVSYTPPEGISISDNLTPADDEAQAYVNAQAGEHMNKGIPVAKAAKGSKAAAPDAEDVA